LWLHYTSASMEKCCWYQLGAFAAPQLQWKSATDLCHFAGIFVTVDAVYFTDMLLCHWLYIFIFTLPMANMWPSLTFYFILKHLWVELMIDWLIVFRDACAFALPIAQ
jgi:hypothetical protein